MFNRRLASSRVQEFSEKTRARVRGKMYRKEPSEFQNRMEPRCRVRRNGKYYEINRK
jgi:hypothetical protein